MQMSQAEKKYGQTNDDRKKSNYSRTSRSSHSKISYGGSISDVEKSTERDYRKIAKKLVNDKSALKDKLRRLLDDVDAKNKDHQIELEKTQDYFQEQINELTDEKDKLGRDLERMREVVMEEKETAREQFEQKLAKHKEVLEKRYVNVPKESQTVKRLENTIATLQERLNKQIEDSENVKNTAEEYVFQREGDLSKRTIELEEQLQKLKEVYAKEHRELLAITKTHKDGMEQLARKLDREKQEEVNNLLIEKTDALLNLQNAKDALEKKHRTIEQQKEEQISQCRFDLEKMKLENERKITELSTNFRKTFEEVRLDYDGKLFEKDRQSKIDSENQKKENEKLVLSLTDENKRRMEGLVETSRKEIEELKKANQKLQIDLDNTSERLIQDTTRREEELKKKHDQALEKITNELLGKVDSKEKELNEHKLRTDKIVGQMEDNNDLLKSQLQQVQLNLKKVQDNSQNMNNQFVTNLNKQKDMAEEEINRRDTTILALERQLKKTAEESLDRINGLDRKLRNTTEEIKELTEKLLVSKTTLEQKMLVYENTKVELQKTKENVDRLVEKIKHVEMEKETITKKAQLEKDTSDKKISMMDVNSKNKDHEFMKYKEDSALLSQMEIKFREDTIKSSELVSKYKTDLDTKSTLLEDLQTKFGALQSTAHQLLIKTKDMEIEVEKKDKESRLAKNELEIANRNASNAFTEMTKFRNNMTEETKLKLADKEKQIADLVRKASQLEQSVKLLEQARDQLIPKLNSAITERDNTKQLLDTFSGPNSEYKLKLREVDKLKEDIDNMTKNFSTRLINIATENKSKEETHKNEVIKLNAQIQAYETQAIQTEQRIEQIKLDFLKKMNDSKKLPPEDELKMNRAIKERDELLSQLSMETKKLEKLQLEYADKSAEIKVRTKYVEDREFELKRMEEIIKNTPAKILDPQLRKARDEAFANLRAAKLDTGKLKEENIQAGQKLQVAEGLVKELERERQVILKSQNELKETFVNNLNQQQTKHEKELKERNDRIRELESMLNDRLK